MAMESSNWNPFEQLDWLYWEEQLQMSLELPLPLPSSVDHFPSTLDPALLLPYHDPNSINVDDQAGYFGAEDNNLMLNYDSFMDESTILPALPEGDDEPITTSFSASPPPPPSPQPPQQQQQQIINSLPSFLDMEEGGHYGVGPTACNVIGIEAMLMGFSTTTTTDMESTGDCLSVAQAWLDQEEEEEVDAAAGLTSSTVMRRRRQGGGGGMRTTKVEGLEYEEIQKYFEMPISKAAKKLGVGLTVLKKRCRELDIRRWPHRKIKSLKSLIRNVQELGLMEEIEKLEENKRMLLKVPQMELTARTKKLRQACFKANYKKRRSMLY
ncbi:hypothetical protein Dimus_000127 [Dionaea muscipula]